MFVGPGSWEDLWGKPPQPVEFSPGEQVAVDKAAKANAVKLLRAEE